VKAAMAASALLLAERIDTRVLERKEAIGTAPLTLTLSEGGVAVLFRYGAVVLFDVSAAAQERFLAELAPALTGPLSPAERDTVEIVIDTGVDDHVDAKGTIHLKDAGIERLQAVADVLAKSLVLSNYETRFSTIFDRTEPLAASLRETGRTGAGERDLMRRIGAVLSVQHNMVGRVEAGEKPDLLWEHPELDRFYTRLADEYELRERSRVLDRKLDVIARTVETLLGLVQNRSSQRVEWYVTALIVAEVVLSLYPLLLGR
jgi:uncharacterized Rmd1/YagE family protein